jgi:hypothetical protein
MQTANASSESAVRSLWSRWSEICSWLRSERDVEKAGIIWSFGVCFPGLWRGKSNFSPIRAALLRKLTDDENWYERIYRDDPKAIWLTPEVFNHWKKQPAVVETMVANLSFWSETQSLSGKLSAIGWAKILQAAYDLALPELLTRIWNRCLSYQWSPDELALFYSIY